MIFRTLTVFIYFCKNEKEKEKQKFRKCEVIFNCEWRLVLFLICRVGYLIWNVRTCDMILQGLQVVLHHHLLVLIPLHQLWLLWARSWEAMGMDL